MELNLTTYIVRLTFKIDLAYVYVKIDNYSLHFHKRVNKLLLCILIQFYWLSDGLLMLQSAFQQVIPFYDSILSTI